MELHKINYDYLIGSYLLLSEYGLVTLVTIAKIVLFVLSVI